MQKNSSNYLRDIAQLAVEGFYMNLLSVPLKNTGCLCRMQKGGPEKCVEG